MIIKIDGNPVTIVCIAWYASDKLRDKEHVNNVMARTWELITQ